MPLVNDPQVISDQYLIVGRQMSPLTINRPAGSVGTLRSSINPLLPDGITLFGDVVSGTPRTTLPLTEYTITWTDDVGDRASKSFRIAIVPLRRLASSLSVESDRPDLTLNVGRVVSTPVPRPINGVPPYDAVFEKAPFTLFDLLVVPATRRNAIGWEPRVTTTPQNPAAVQPFNVPGLSLTIIAIAWRQTGRGSFADNIFITWDSPVQAVAALDWLNSLPGGWELRIGSTVFDGSTFTQDGTTSRLISPTTSSPFTIGVQQRIQIVPKALPDRPAGLSIRNFAIVGSPTTTQPQLPYRVTYTDRLGVTGSIDFDISILAAVSPLTWPSLDLITLTEGEIIDPIPLPTPSGGTPPYTYSASNLPPGIEYDRTPNTLTGRPDNPADYSVAYTVTDSTGTTATTTQVISVQRALDPPVNTEQFIQDQVLVENEDYSVRLPDWVDDILITTGLEGTLPTGLQFNNKILSGTPTQTGRFRLVYRGVSNETNLSTTLNFNLRVVSARSGTPDPPIEGRSLTHTDTALNILILPLGDASVRYFEYGYKEFNSLDAPRYFRAQGSGSATTEFSIPNLSPDTRYQVYIRAVNRNGPGTALVLDKTTLPDPDSTTRPLAPIALSAIGGNREVRLFWANPKNFAISTYEYNINNGPWIRVGGATNATTEVEVGGLTNGISYTFQVRALTSVAGASSSVTVIPTGVPLNETVKTRILGEVILHIGGVEIDISDRVLDGRWKYGRTRGTDSFDGGYCRITIDTSDDFLTEGGGGRYQPRQLYGQPFYLNALVYDRNNRVHRRTMFGGFVNEIAGWRAHGLRSTVVLEAVSIFRKLTEAKLIFNGRNAATRLPEEFTGDRIKRILNLAGISYNDDLIDRGTIRCLRENVGPGTPGTTDVFGNVTGGTAARVFEGNALALCEQVAHTEGGRFYVQQGFNYGVGQIRFEQRGPNPPTHLNISAPPVEGHAQPRPRVTTEDDTSALHTIIEFTSAERAGPTVRRTTNVFGDVTTSGGTAEKRVSLETNENAVELYGPRTLSRQLLSSFRDTQNIARWYLDVFSVPRYHADSVPLIPHHEDPDVALKIVEATIGDLVRLNYIPPPFDESRVVSSSQRIDGVEGYISPISGANEISLGIRYSLLSPEATAYWVLNELGSAELGSKTRLAPPLRDDVIATVPSGRFTWEDYDPNQPADRATVSSNRFSAYLARQSIPIYENQIQRDLQEGTNIEDGMMVAMIGESTDRPTRRMEIWSYSRPNTQWVKEAELSLQDANPNLGVFTLDVDPYDQLDSGHTLE